MGFMDKLGLRRKEVAQPTHFVINDVSEKEEHADAIREVANTIYGSNYRMVTASELRRKVVEFLRKQGIRYNVVLLGKSGGKDVFGGIDFKRLGLADHVDEIGYSSHHTKEISSWQVGSKLEGPFEKRLRPILEGGKKMVLVIDSDIGWMGITKGKLDLVKDVVKEINPHADVHIVGGIVSKNVPRRFVRYAAYITPLQYTRVERLSEGLGASKIKELARMGIHLPKRLSLA